MVGLQSSPAIMHLVGFLLFLLVGLLGTFWPREVQTYELRLYAGITPVAFVSFLQGYVGSETYVRQVRTIGVFCLIAAGALLYAALDWAPYTLPIMRCGSTS